MNFSKSGMDPLILHKARVGFASTASLLQMATVAKQEICSWQQHELGCWDSTDFGNNCAGRAHFSLPQWQSFRVQRWCRCIMTRQNDRLNLAFHRYLHQKFGLVLGIRVQVYLTWAEKMQAENLGMSPGDFLPSASRQQHILHYRVLSGNTFLGEMALRLLNKRPSTGPDRVRVVLIWKPLDWVTWKLSSLPFFVDEGIDSVRILISYHLLWHSLQAHEHQELCLLVPHGLSHNCEPQQWDKVLCSIQKFFLMGTTSL